MTILFSKDYKDFEFPATPNIVYILYTEMKGSQIYFYVGQSSRNIGRIGDYVSAKFTAPTDFKVGEAIKYIRGKNLPIRVLYRETQDPISEENKLIQKLRSNYTLLNDLRSYDYTKSNEAYEKKNVHDFMDKILDKY